MDPAIKRSWLGQDSEEDVPWIDMGILPPEGIFQLAGSEDAVMDIVFVHGLTGDHESSWTSKNNTFWPKTLLSQSIPNARILTWGYNNEIPSYHREMVKDLCKVLTATRIHEPDRPIIFVGHDMGAALCANVIYIGTEDTERDARHIADCVTGIVFLGMPHTFRGWTRTYSNFSSEVTREIEPIMLHNFLSYTREWPMRLFDDVLKSRRRLNTFDFYEQDDSDFYGKLFDGDTPTLPDNCLLIPGNHITMCKFDSSDEPGYILIKWLLQKWIKELPKQTSGGPAHPAEPSIATNVPALNTPAELRILHEVLGLSKDDAVNTSEDVKEKSKPLLSPEAVRWLASKELLSSIQQESLTISTAPLLESFTTSMTDPSSTGGNWSLSEDDKSFLRKVDVPIRLYSAETYEFLGYQRRVAEHLWDTFDPSVNPSFTLFEVSKEYLENNLPTESDHDCKKFMDTIGICESLRKSVLDSYFSNIRSTASCEFWLRTAFEIRWQELNALNEDLLKAMKRTASTGEQRTGSSAPSNDRGTNTEQSESSGHQDTEQPPSEHFSGEKEEEGPRTETDPATKTLDPNAEVVTLWRGGSKKSIESAKNHGKLRLKDIRSIPGDFCGTSKVPYFATLQKTAELYGAFHATLSRVGTPPYLLHFKVDKKWLKTLQHRCLWAKGVGNDTCNLGMSNCPDKEIPKDPEERKKRSWEHIVFTCRTDDDWTPTFLTYRDLVIGHIAKFHDEEMKEKGTKEKMNAGVLLVDDKPAVQYAFISEVSQKQLQVEASDVITECLTGLIVRRCRDDCTGKPRVDDVRLIDLCQACKDKANFGSE